MLVHVGTNKERGNKTMNQEEIDKDWDEFFSKPRPWLYSNYGDKAGDSDESGTQESFQKFCDHDGNNRYPRE
jgi:hypothetical protein